MRHFLFAVLLCLSPLPAAWSQSVAPGSPKLLASHDEAMFIKPGWIRDPYITLAPDGYYYLTGTTPLPGDPREQSDRYNTGLGELSIVGWKMQAWRSSDLLHWEDLGTPFTLRDGIWPSVRPKAFAEQPQDVWRLWAPELHFFDGRWVLVHTSPAPVAGANLSLTTGAALTGPWSNPVGAALGKRHDPSLFRDTDGQTWLIWGATEIAPLKPDFSGFQGPPVRIGPSGETSKMGHEGCLMHKIGGKYVLFGTGWSTGEMRKGSYNLYYAIADQITGPYSERKFVGRFLGHGTPFQDRDGRWWCTAFYNGNVPPRSDKDLAANTWGDNAYTINEQGVTLCPLDVTVTAAGEVHIRALDPRYARPGLEEAQQFPLD